MKGMNQTLHCRILTLELAPQVIGLDLYGIAA